MINEVDKCPDVFDKIPQGKWYELILENGDQYGWFAFQCDTPGTIGVHLEVMAWAPSVLRQMLLDWDELKKIAREMGAKDLYAANKNYKDKRWARLIKHFGFRKVSIIALSYQEV